MARHAPPRCSTSRSRDELTLALRSSGGWTLARLVDLRARHRGHTRISVGLPIAAADGLVLLGTDFRCFLAGAGVVRDRASSGFHRAVESLLARDACESAAHRAFSRELSDTRRRWRRCLRFVTTRSVTSLPHQPRKSAIASEHPPWGVYSGVYSPPAFICILVRAPAARAGVNMKIQVQQRGGFAGVTHTSGGARLRNPYSRDGRSDRKSRETHGVGRVHEAQILAEPWRGLSDV